MLNKERMENGRGLEESGGYYVSELYCHYFSHPEYNELSVIVIPSLLHLCCGSTSSKGGVDVNVVYSKRKHLHHFLSSQRPTSRQIGALLRGGELDFIYVHTYRSSIAHQNCNTCYGYNLSSGNV